MAKRANTNQKLSKAVSRLSEDLQRYYQIGVEALDAFKKADKQRLRGLPEKFGIKRDHVLKARRFAERLGDYKSLTQLARLRKQQKKPLGWGHVRFLVSVPDPVRRFQTLRDAVNGSWSKDQLKQAIQLQERRTSRREADGQRKAGGRRPARPATNRETFLRLQQLSESWLALFESPAGANSSALNDAESKLKHEVSDFFRSTSPATPELKAQVAGLVEVLSCQAEELCKIVAVAQSWLNREAQTKQPSVRRENRPRTGSSKKSRR